MQSIHVYLGGSITNAKKFVNTVSKYDFDIDLVSNRYRVDAKSLMGIFSLDLEKPIELQADADDTGDLFQKLKEFVPSSETRNQPSEK
jgi:phosphotransferase system HPr (HPr) family protein